MKKFLVYFIIGAFIYSQMYPFFSDIAGGIIEEYNLENTAIVRETTRLATYFD